jgi:hypothetical protein
MKEEVSQEKKQRNERMKVIERAKMITNRAGTRAE